MVDAVARSPSPSAVLAQAAAIPLPPSSPSPARRSPSPSPPAPAVPAASAATAPPTLAALVAAKGQFPSAPPSESNRSNDVYMQTPGEGSSDDSSSGSETESEVEVDEPAPASQRSSQRFGGAPLTQLSSSPRKGGSHLAALDQAESDEIDEEVNGDNQDSDDDDGSVQYSAAESEPEDSSRAARRQSRVSFSQLSARSGGGRRRMSAGSSDEEEGEMPPGLVTAEPDEDDVAMDADEEAFDAPVTAAADDDVAMDEDAIQNGSSPMRTNVTAPSSPIVEPSQVLPESGQATSPAAARAPSESVASSAGAPSAPPSPAGSHSSVPNWVTHTQSEPVPSSPPATTGPRRLSNLAGANSSSPAKPSLSEIDELDASQPPASFSRATEALDRAFALDDRPSAAAPVEGRTSTPVAEAPASVADAVGTNGTQETEIPATQLSQGEVAAPRRSSPPGDYGDSQPAATSPLPSTPKGTGEALAPPPSVQVNPPSSPTKPVAAVAAEPVEETPSVPQTPAGGRTTRSRVAKGGVAAPPPPPSTRVTRRAASQQPQQQTLEAPEPVEQQVSASQPVGRRLRSREPSEKPTQVAAETPRGTPVGRAKKGGKVR